MSSSGWRHVSLIVVADGSRYPNKVHRRNNVVEDPTLAEAPSLLKSLRSVSRPQASLW